MDDLIAFVRARLDEWEGLARQALPLQTGSRDEGQPVEHVSWRRSAGHPEFALRHVKTLRAIVELHAREHDCPVIVPTDNPEVFAGNLGYVSTEHIGDKDDFLNGVCTTLRELAADFGTHPDYRPEWAPGS